MNTKPKRAQENADFIVRAVNSHDELLAALERAERELSFATLGAFNNLEFLPDSPTRAALIAARAALAKARGGETT